MEEVSASGNSSLEIPPRTLGEKVFDFLPETVSGKLAASYKREELARRIVGKLGKEQRSDKSIHDGVVSAVYLDEDISSSIKKSILKHLGGNIPVESPHVNGDQNLVEVSVDQDAKKSASKKVEENRPFANSPRLPNRILDDYGENTHSKLPRPMRLLPGDSDDPPRSSSEENKRRSYDADNVVSTDPMKIDSKKDVQNDVSTLKKSTDEIRDTSRKSIEEHTRETDEALKTAFGNTEALPGDQKVNPPREGYFGSPDYKEAIDDQAEIQPEKRRGIDADGIVEGLGVVGEAAPEIVMEEDGEQTEPKGDSRETLLELKSRVEALKKVADEKRGEYLQLKRRNEAKWYDVRKYFFRTKQEKSTLPQNLIEEIQYKETEWKHALTEYSEARLLLAKRESLEAKDGQKRTTSEVMAGALNEMKLRNSVENYNAWKDASWGDRDDSWFTHALGRTEKWAEEYRKLDWKKRVAISAAVAGVAVSGVVLGSVGLTVLGGTGAMVLQILGSYGFARGVIDSSEARANKKALEYNEKALSAFKEGEELDFEALEFQMKNYADRTVRDLDRAVKENRRRIRRGALSGVVLFTTGNVFAYRDAIQDFAGQVSNEATKFLEQMKIITGLEDFHGTPVSIAGAVEEVANTANLKSEISSVVNAPLTIEGTEAVGKIAGESVKMLSIEAGSSIEGAMIKSGIDPGDTHRAFLAFLKEMKDGGYPKMESMEKVLQGKMMPGDRVFVVPTGNAETPIRIVGIDRMADKFSVLQPIHAPGTEAIWKELSNMPSVPDTSLTTPPDMFGDERPDVLPNQAVARAVLEGNAIEAASAHPEPIPPTPETVYVPSSSPEPPDAFDRYGTAAKVIPPVAGLAAAGIAGKIVRDGIKLNEKKRSKEEKKGVEESNSEWQVIQKKALEVLSQVASLTEISVDRRGVLWDLRESYGLYSEQRPPDGVFEDTRKKITTVIFGSEDVPEDVLDNMFLAVAQRGIGEPENKNLEEIRTGIKNGYSVFQVLFGRTGERLPAGKITGLSVRDVIRLFTERFLTGKVPEELKDSSV